MYTEKATGYDRKILKPISSPDDSSPLVSIAPIESNLPLAAGLSIAGTSLLAVTSFLLWFLKHFWKKGKGGRERTPKTFLKIFFPH
jgi:hypothetical protein